MSDQTGPAGLGVWLAALAASAKSIQSLFKPKQTPGGAASKVKLGGRIVVKAVALVTVALALGLMTLAVTSQAAINGPWGRLSGLGARWWLDGWGIGRVPEVARWLIVLGVLGLIAVTRTAHHWSFLPVYRDRLAAAFSLSEARIPDRTHPDDLPRLSELPIPEGPPESEVGRRWPELLLCTTGNVNDTALDAEIPAGRWGDSITFSPRQVGGPSWGYVPTTTYENAMYRRRQSDIRLPTLVAISGAAFSPAMGKFDYGPIGAAMAALNLRLGVWLPNPAALAASPLPNRWRRRPSWSYLLRELFGIYRKDHPLLYVTDGGHWENLGLVELLRRGCTEIYVISAAGDGPQAFGTIAEAIALAREQCQVEIQVDLTPLRAPVGEPPPRPERQLLRRGSDGSLAAQTMAPATRVVGWFDRAGVRGRVMFVEANLTADLPWDVHAHAESQVTFPDDSTADQQFNHRQFESYRRLGEHMLAGAQDDPAWVAAGSWVDSGDEADLTALRLAVHPPREAQVDGLEEIAEVLSYAYVDPGSARTR